VIIISFLLYSLLGEWLMKFVEMLPLSLNSRCNTGVGMSIGEDGRAVVAAGSLGGLPWPGDVGFNVPLLFPNDRKLPTRLLATLDFLGCCLTVSTWVLPVLVSVVSEEASLLNTSGLTGAWVAS
jgi:hypothetical protein